MTKEKMKSLFAVHTNGQDEWIKVPKRTYDKMIDMFCDTHETQLKAKDESIAELFIANTDALIKAYHRDIENKRLKAKIAELEAKLERLKEF